MSEREIFLAVLDLPAAEWTNFLDQACGADAAMRGRIASLLRSHEDAGSFLGVPAVAPQDPDTATTRTHGHDGATDDDEVPLGFLEKATRPDSLGRIGHYEVLQVLGKGGFGIVFRAFDDVLQRVVAVKVLSPQMAATSPARKRFLREARSSAAVRHENVVQVYEVGEQPLPYIAMEFIPGETLQQRLDRSGPLDVIDVVRIGQQIAEGLAAAHANDLIHRDIKPGNILLEGGAQRVKITDFGLARAADDASISQSGIIAGTPMYMAPEQAKGEYLDHRADLFSLGSVLYQMAAGRPPFRATGTLAVLKRVTEDTPRPIREIIPETPQWLCDIISKLHAKKPDDRYQSARDVADVLADCEAQLKSHSKLKDFSRIPSSKQPVAVKSGSWKWAAAAALLLPLIGLAVTETVGVTHLFQAQQGTTDPGKTAAEPAPVVVAKQDTPDADRFRPLFNGKDLNGWKTHPDRPGRWSVEDGTLVRQGLELSHLFSERGDYENFHLRAEVRVNGTHSGALHFRSEFGFGFDLTRVGDGSMHLPVGYEVQIACPGTQSFPTGTLTRLSPAELGHSRHLPTSDEAKADGWVLLEVVAQGDQFKVLVDRKVVVDYQETAAFRRRGHVVLQAWWGTDIRFRKIEIKEMPANPVPVEPPTFKNNLGMEFVIVPKGKSWLGGGNGTLGDQEVEIPADFYLGKYEVTQEEWEKVMGANPGFFSRMGPGKDAVKDIANADLKRFPVELVSWLDCQAFVRALNKREKEAGWVYRLPTQVEWEYACRGGPTADRADSAFDFYLAKPTNTLLADTANVKDIGKNRTCAAGSYQPNRLGLYDMHGNVWEWCADAEKGADGTWLPVFRGGSYRTTVESCRASKCTSSASGHKSYNIGLRLARVPSGASSSEAKTPPVAVAPFTDADVKRIATLPAAEQVEEVRKELVRRNPGFDGKLDTKIEDGVVTECRICTDQVADVSPIRVFNALRVLNCSGTWTDKANGQLADLTPLRGMPLTWLELGYNQFDDLKPLEGMQLSYLGIYICARVSDLSPLTGMPLKRMNLGCTGVRDLSPLKGMNITWLNLWTTPVKDLSPLKGMPIGVLNIARTGISDLDPLQGIELDEIHLDPKNITRGLDMLRRMKSLKTIGTSFQPYAAAEFWERYDKGEFAVAPFTDADVERIAALPAGERVEEVRKELVKRNPGFDGKVGHKIEGDALTEFAVNTDQILDISPVRALSGLVYLDLRGTYPNKGKLADLSPLKGMKLSRLDCSSTQIANLSPLTDVPLTTLHVNHNPVTDLTPLKV